MSRGILNNDKMETIKNINVGYLSALFDTAIEYIGKIAVDERISEPIHKAINPMLDDMIGQLHSMKNNTMATIMFEDGEETKVVQHKDCDEGRICPKCGKAMILHKEERTFYPIWWECDGCRHKEKD